jgi:hypothetical protein
MPFYKKKNYDLKKKEKKGNEKALFLYCSVSDENKS